MPVYLLHGFRWPRPLIRIHIILNDLDDAAAEWLTSPSTSAALTANLHSLHPSIMADIPKVHFVEQYDPSDVSPEARSQPYAYVADIVEEVRLGVEVDEVRGRGIGDDVWGAMVELRDKLAPGEKIAWFVVVCGDTERSFAPSRVEEGERWRSASVGAGEKVLVNGDGEKDGKEGKDVKKEKHRSKLARLFGRSGGDKELKRSKSNKSLNGQRKAPQEPPPPLPSISKSYAVQPINTTHAHTISATSTTGQPSSTQPTQATLPAPPRTGILPSPPPTAELPPPPSSTSQQQQAPSQQNGHKVQVMADRPATAGADSKGQQQFQTVRVPSAETRGEEVVRPTVASG